MITADTQSYATTISGYVITALLGVIMLGGGYIIRQINLSVKDVAEAVRKLKDEVVAPMKEDIAVIKSKQEEDHPSPRRGHKRRRK